MGKIPKRWAVTRNIEKLRLMVKELEEIFFDKFKVLEMIATLHMISEDEDLIESFSEKYVEAKIIDLKNILEQLKDCDLEDLISVYSLEISTEYQKLSNILSKDVWLKIFEYFKNQGLRDLTLVTDSVILSRIFLKIFREYCVGIIIDEENPYGEILKEYLFKYVEHKSLIFDLKNAKTILLAFLKQKKKETSQKIKSIGRSVSLGSVLGVITLKEFFKSKAGLIYNLNLYDGTFLSIVSIRRLLKGLVFIVMMKTSYLIEPFYFGDNYVAIFRSNVPTIFDPRDVVSIEKMFGVNEYEVREGLITGRDRAFIVTLGEHISKGKLVFVFTSKIDNKGFRNAGFVETETLYPVIRPTDIYWPMSISEKYIVLPVKNGKLLSETELKNMFPNTYEFFNRERHILTSRRISYYTLSGDPFYSLDLNEEIFSPYKIIWKRVSKEFVPSLALPKFGKPPIPISGVQYIPLNDISEAYYLIALLSSKIYREIISGYAFTGNIAIKAIRSLKIPKFNPKNELHYKLSLLGKELLSVGYEHKEKILEEINSVIKEFF